MQKGTRAGEYILDDLIGRGGFGEVWRARHHVWTEQVVAIKLPTDPAYLRQLQREGFAAPSLHHPAIVKAIGFDPFANPPYLAMEYVPGSSLRPLIVSKKLSPEDAVNVLRVVIEALGHAHQQGIVHRDVKPENVLVHERALKEGFDSPGVIKLTDFGLGQNTRRPSADSVAMSMSVEGPEARTLAGTLEYMSPEQRGSLPVDGRTDLYACGVMLFEMLTGERPAGNELPSELNPKSPKWLDEVFKKAYARLERRYADSNEFLQALRTRNKGSPSAHSTGTHGQVKVNPSIAGSCMRCSGVTNPGDQFCIHCGAQVVAHVRRCAVCGGYPTPDDRFCILCGSELHTPVGVS